MRSKVVSRCLFGLLIIFSSLLAQEQNQTNKASVTDADINLQATPQKDVIDEYILETISIEAVIEKPSVALIPRKIQTDVGELPFKIRSFDKELKGKPDILLEVTKKLEAAKKVKKIEKLFENESK